MNVGRKMIAMIENSRDAMKREEVKAKAKEKEVDRPSTYTGALSKEMTL